MIKVDITEEVKKKRQSSEKAAQEVLEAAQLLIEGDAQQEREILKQIGLGKNIIEAERVNSLNLERKTFESEYGERVVMQESEIRDLCLKYDLRFLTTENYNGSIDLNIGPEIRNFVKENNISPSRGDFYLLAPGKAFNLKQRELHGPSKFSVEMDPVLFYKVPDNSSEKMFVTVHKWGNDFTIFRYLRGLMYENLSSYLTIQFAIGFALSMILWTAVDGNFTVGYGNIVSASLTGIAYALISTAIRCARLGKGDAWNEAFNVKLWNSNIKM